MDDAMWDLLIGPARRGSDASGEAVTTLPAQPLAGVKKFVWLFPHVAGTDSTCPHSGEMCL